MDDKAPHPNPLDRMLPETDVPSGTVDPDRAIDHATAAIRVH
jgi:hypothetical protein